MVVLTHLSLAVLLQITRSRCDFVIAYFAFLFLTDVIRQAINHSHTVIDTIADLDFCGRAEPSPVYDPDADDEEFQEDPLYGVDEVPFDVKEKAVAFWQSGDKRKGRRAKGAKFRSLSAVQKNFRMVKRREQLYRYPAVQINFNALLKQMCTATSCDVY